MISDVVEKGFQEYTDFLNEAETKNVLNQKLAYEISSNYMAYYINSFKRRAILGSSFILMDTSENVIYSSFSNEEIIIRTEQVIMLRVHVIKVVAALQIDPILLDATITRQAHPFSDFVDLLERFMLQYIT